MWLLAFAAAKAPFTALSSPALIMARAAALSRLRAYALSSAQTLDVYGQSRTCAHTRVRCGTHFRSLLSLRCAEDPQAATASSSRASSHIQQSAGRILHRQQPVVSRQPRGDHIVLSSRAIPDPRAAPGLSASPARSMGAVPRLQHRASVSACVIVVYRKPRTLARVPVRMRELLPQGRDAGSSKEVLALRSQPSRAHDPSRDDRAYISDRHSDPTGVLALERTPVAPGDLGCDRDLQGTLPLG